MLTWCLIILHNLSVSSRKTLGFYANLDRTEKDDRIRDAKI